MNARTGEACTSRKLKPGHGTRTRINVNVALRMSGHGLTDSGNVSQIRSP